MRPSIYHQGVWYSDLLMSNEQCLELISDWATPRDLVWVALFFLRGLASIDLLIWEQLPIILGREGHERNFKSHYCT